MIRPVDAPRSQGFGENPTRYLPWDSWLIQTFGNYQPDGHSGEDYACDIGTPVRAVTGGTVLHIGWMGGTYADNPWWIAPNFAGYCAVVDHGAFIGIYGHCKDGSAKVSKGAWVSEGQVFILSGNTGGSTGPHLHFEILPDQYILQSSFYGRIDPETIFAGELTSHGTITHGTTTSQTIQEDELTAQFEVDARGEFDSLRLFQADVRGELDKLRALDIDLRGDLANKGQQLAALTAANGKLVELLADSKGLSVDDIKAALSAAIADGIKVTVEAK